MPVLCIHGSTVASILFDAPDASLLDHLAAAGHSAYALDIRGYSRSQADPRVNPDQPYARACDAVKDVDAAMDRICRLEEVSQVALIGASWGTIIAGIYASQVMPERVSRLVLCAPLCDAVDEAELTRLTSGQDLAALPAFRHTTAEGFWTRWTGEHRGRPGDAWKIPAVVKAVLSSFDTASSAPPSKMSMIPNGCLVDLSHSYRGSGLYEPGRIDVPTLVIRGSRDPTSTRQGALSIFERLACADNVYTEVAGGGHFGLIEQSGPAIRGAIAAFLNN
jgi:pimeloyl-ACP methyl ester carboxylesterase